MNDDAGFLREILASPSDRSLRLIYADWLDERGDLRGEFLRLELQWRDLPDDHPERKVLQLRLLAVRATLDRDWLMALDQAPVENCLLFAFQCPQRWELLTPTSSDRIRFCDRCQQKVYHCQTVQEGQRHASLGRCVAIDSRLARTPGDLRVPQDYGMTVGVIAPRHRESERSTSPPPAPPPSAATPQRWWQFWKRFNP